MAVRNPAYIINGQFLSFFSRLNPNSIEKIDVIKRDTTIHTIQYFGQINIKTKPGYPITPISLTQLKSKYTDLKNNTVIFLIDNEIVTTADYDSYFIDENYIFKIVIQKISNDKEGLQLNVVKLFTKSEENILKSKKIMIRGLQDLSVNK